MNKSTQEIKCPHCGVVFNLDEAGYADILNQVRNVEFEKALHDRLEEQQRIAEAKTRQALAEAKAASDKKASELEAKLKEELAQARAALDKADTEKELAVNKATQDAKAKQAELEAKIEQAQTEKKAALLEQKAEFNDALKLKEMEVNTAKAALEERLRFSRELSTQGIGAEFENWCEAEFEKIRYLAFPDADFIKDTTLAEGTKGDYIFRDYIEGIEFISIMFEMKNEADDTQKGKKNKDFYSKLDKDRIKKKCEFAILVSTLEPDNDVFNKGIYLVHEYEKMLVVRPQFFIEIIGMLRAAAKTSFEDRKQLQKLREQNIDITKFEEELNSFVSSFDTSAKHFHANMKKALDDIDKSITDLEKVKGFIKTALGHLDTASNKVEKVSVKSLTRGNPTMQAKFKELNSGE